MALNALNRPFFGLQSLICGAGWLPVMTAGSEAKLPAEENRRCRQLKRFKDRHSAYNGCLELVCFVWFGYESNLPLPLPRGDSRVEGRASVSSPLSRKLQYCSSS